MIPSLAFWLSQANTPESCQQTWSPMHHARGIIESQPQRQCSDIHPGMWRYDIRHLTGQSGRCNTHFIVDPRETNSSSAVPFPARPQI